MMKKVTIVMVVFVVVCLMIETQAYTGPWTMPHGRKRFFGKIERVSSIQMSICKGMVRGDVGGTESQV